MLTALGRQERKGSGRAKRVRFAPDNGHGADIRGLSQTGQELTSTGVPTGIERQFGQILSWLLETVRLRSALELAVGARAEN